MAKKTRKPNLPQQTLERARRELAKQGDAVIVETPAEVETKSDTTPNPTPAPRRRVVVETVDLRSEYTYVITDLRNMALLAAFLMAVLVVMSFFI